MTIECPIEYTLSILKSKWVILIIRELNTGTKRFSELKRNINNITQKVLTSSLRFLESENIINRKVYPIIPPKVEYNLTSLGQSLLPILEELKKWGQKYIK